MALITTDSKRIVVGLGKTGLSCARYLARKQIPFSVADTRDNPPGAEELAAIDPNAKLFTGPLDADLLCSATELYISPGVGCADPAIQAAAAAGVVLSGDIDLFCREVSAPIVAITGSNAKSTVTTLVGEMASEQGFDTGVGGNLGLPVLDMLAEGEKDLYVLELSSFQLETTHDLRAEVATVLNVSPDHMDRYENFQGYYQAKHRIFRGCKHAVVNRDDALSSPLLPMGIAETSFGLSKPDLGQFGIIEVDGVANLAKGLDTVVDVHSLKMRGEHNVSNALAAMALAERVDVKLPAMLSVLSRFVGLEHRCQWVRELEGVQYYNDSKGTNVGATVAALDGFGPSLRDDQKIVLIAGGEGKGADFSELTRPVSAYVRTLVLIGDDADKIADVTQEAADIVLADNMNTAVKLSRQNARPGDLVLLSPACASFDMFKSFNHRGDVFMEEVNAL